MQHFDPSLGSGGQKRQLQGSPSSIILSSTNNKDYKWLKHKVKIKISFSDVDKHACHITPNKNGNQKESKPK